MSSLFKKAFVFVQRATFSQNGFSQVKKVHFQQLLYFIYEAHEKIETVYPYCLKRERDSREDCRRRLHSKVGSWTWRM